MNKNNVIETKEAIQIIINKLSNEESNIHLVDRSDRFDIIIDDNVKQLLISYYKSKVDL